ncbi:MAG: hypothetical protein KF699_00745 [Phycisphaeraceae bacterium]|nr:hypothetical protein [Phycisphaeraceae bacterium]MBX3406118.1 hypothetical protein [Phycisphaeraceae bacterium]
MRTTQQRRGAATMCYAEPRDSRDSDAVLPPALLRDLPRDQALGLRLIVLARAAAALHMAQVSPESRNGASARAGTNEGATP